MDRSNSRLYGFPPCLYLIGAQKCATTYLAECIAEHPDIELANPKEPHFFSQRFQEDLASYRRFFSDLDNRILLDASPSYSMAPSLAKERREDNPRYGVPSRIKQASPDPKFVYIVRDPVERTYSSYWHAVRAGEETKDFETAIREKSRYLDGSRYYFQIQEYLQQFSWSSVLLLEMREVTTMPDITLHKIWRHLGIDAPDALVAPDAPRNRSYRLNVFGQWLARSGNTRSLMKASARGARVILPRFVYKGLSSLVSKDLPPMTPAQRELVEQELKDDARQFFEMSGMRFESFADL